ncbi:MAG: NAD-dependent epimerase/dehydratase family protein [Clostridiaceae bacterium]
MKHVLITGANSYIGTSFEAYIKLWPDQYQVDTVDMIGEAWREKSFVGYDAVLHVAGIAHSDTGNVNEEQRALYYKINTELTVETAKKAKADGARQFIFMSSAIVYGDSAPIGCEKIITKNTIPQPANFYGDSKLQAENGILPLQDDSFNVVVLRPPMIYGKGCRGNYPVLSKYARKLPLFPEIDNYRSMLYIENLLEFLRLIIDNNEVGIFFPQNEEYTRTSDMIRLIADAHGKGVRLTKAFNPLLFQMSRWLAVVNKVFGNLCYALDMSDYKQPYCKYGLAESIQKIEGE